VENAYFPRDVSGWNEVAHLQSGLRLVDCGAFDGDTLRDAARRDREGEIKLQAIAAFEPDAGNFASLAQSAREVSCETLLWPCGVWRRSETLRFRADGTAASALSQDDHFGDGETVVSCVALDDALRGWKPTLLKMDIEGAEPDALDGARELIAQARPALAICAYHRAAHLWTLAQQIRQWDFGYDFFLRSHGYNGFDTVLYGVPQQQ
jgi:FkbM family methyltransferase